MIKSWPASFRVGEFYFFYEVIKIGGGPYIKNMVIRDKSNDILADPVKGNCFNFILQ